MGVYTITAFDKSGSVLVDESFEANSEKEAKELGEQLLQKKDLDSVTHRCTSSSGKLILFHR